MENSNEGRTLIGLPFSDITAPDGDILFPKRPPKFLVQQHLPLESCIILMFPATENDHA
jgi:hypothetical protein